MRSSEVRAAHFPAVVLVSACLFFAGCGSVIQPLAASPVTDVYLAGFEQGAASPIAMYWKNGVGIQLSDPTHGASAEGIAVSGNDVYVVGSDNAPGRHQEVTLWKNGLATALTDGTKDGYASGIVISGSDVYVSGSELGLDASGNLYSVAEYWKNGVPNILTNTTSGAMAYSIFVSGPDVYVAGFGNKTTQTGPSSFYTTQVARYWKNGVPVDLTVGTAPAGAYSIFVSGNDVYVSGYNCLTPVSACNRAAYWKNGSLVQLPTSNISTAVSIDAANGNVYIADNETLQSNSYDQATLWVNVSAQVLGQAPIVASNALTLFGDDVYVAGASGSSAGFFKNGSFQAVNGVANMDSSAFAIAVVPH